MTKNRIFISCTMRGYQTFTNVDFYGYCTKENSDVHTQTHAQTPANTHTPFIVVVAGIVMAAAARFTALFATAAGSLCVSS